MANKRCKNLTDKQINQIKELFKEELSNYKSISIPTLGAVNRALNRAFIKAKLINNGLSLSTEDRYIHKIIQLRDQHGLSWNFIANSLNNVLHRTTISRMYNEYKQTIKKRF